ncbi:MAG TPA: heme exporter protein CcmB, partial [Fimbriimonadaceae bacterium]|nr:heme exporter protein CcmB [Fimbriimonadaceae bacterium]
MSSSWRAEVLAVLRKELVSELRSRAGVLTAGLFSAVSVFAVSMAAFGERLTGSLAAGLLWVTLLFASIVALPRTFVSEQETGTLTLLRLVARPETVFWGKALFNVGQMLLTSLFLSILFLMLLGLEIQIPGLYLLSMVGGSVALAGTVTLCGALVAQAANRSALVGAIALPPLLPLLAMGVGSARVALGEGGLTGGYLSALGLLFYGVAVFAAGPLL